MNSTAAERVNVEPWPAKGLEWIDECPVCGSPERAVLHRKLTDRVFWSAPGEWTLWRCSNCRSAYYDPRPTRCTISLAYRHYYTHFVGDEPRAAPLYRRVRTALANGYRNRRFGTKLRPASFLGYVAGRLLPPLAVPLETEYRYLPRLPRPHARLLDVGCGGGDWLALAREAGWYTVGADPDPVARERGTAAGIEIRAGGAETWLTEAGTFDVVTAVHSIEHAHDPNKMLQDIFALLRPGGQLTIETPNIDGWGHDLFGRNWIGVDPPRHLVIFTWESLRLALDNAGFTSIRQRRRSPYFPALALYSARIAAGYRFDDPSAPARLPNFWTRLRANRSRRKAEALLFTAVKPAPTGR